MTLSAAAILAGLAAPSEAVGTFAPAEPVAPTAAGRGALVVAHAHLPVAPEWRGTLITPVGYEDSETGIPVTPVWVHALLAALVAEGWPVAEWAWVTGHPQRDTCHLLRGQACGECRLLPSGLWVSGAAAPRVTAILAQMGVPVELAMDAEEREPLPSLHHLRLHGVEDDGHGWERLHAARLAVIDDDWDSLVMIASCQADLEDILGALDFGVGAPWTWAGSAIDMGAVDALVGAITAP